MGWSIIPGCLGPAGSAGSLRATPWRGQQAREPAVSRVETCPAALVRGSPVWWVQMIVSAPPVPPWPGLGEHVGLLTGLPASSHFTARLPIQSFSPGSFKNPGQVTMSLCGLTPARASIYIKAGLSSELRLPSPLGPPAKLSSPPSPLKGGIAEGQYLEMSWSLLCPQPEALGTVSKSGPPSTWCPAVSPPGCCPARGHH